ncbi:MAG: TatD family hydrolase, partial [Lentisphaeria bacterium]|nr:TatD family hydrolase [Lentisphaeria bacterium]
DRILSETDCPDLPAPQYHGQLSQPWQVHAVVQAIADIKKATPEAVAATIAQNWQELFTQP